MHLGELFDTQIRNLLAKGYPVLFNQTEKEFIQSFDPLKSLLLTLDLPALDFDRGYLPFVIVIKSTLVPTQQAMSLAVKDGKKGITKLFPLEPTDFVTTPEVNIPNKNIYLLIGIDRGKQSLNQAPSVALEHITAARRSPLTIDEGVAIITHYPDFLRKNNCFSLLASRHPGDLRIPAIWINGTKNPNLGWCWNGNPHTWLGSASCETRLA